MEPKLLDGLKAVVTGGTSGIGKEIALTFAKHGAHVAIFGKNEERGRLAVQEIEQEVGPGYALFVSVDVSSTADVKNAIDHVIKEFTTVDVLVNNAGVTKDQLLMKMTEDDWDEVMAVNVKSCYNLTRALVRQMMRAKRGKIINMSSVVGITGNAGQVNYAASKAAIIGFTKALAKEVATRNICVNCIAPGFIETPMTMEMTDEQREIALSLIPLKRMGATADVANAALFLASSLSDYITGQVISVDGGMAS